MSAPLALEARQNAAALAGLSYCLDDCEGYSRRRCGKGFAYYDCQGQLVKSHDLKCRFHSLAIPRAWSDVWISPDERSHLQVTGRDEAGRKQYIYHPDWEDLRSRQKFGLILDFAHGLPTLRESYAELLDHRLRGRDQVLGAALLTLDRTHIRIGNDDYAQERGTHGLTTLTREDLTLKGSRIILDFDGKSGQRRHVEVEDERLAKALAPLHRAATERLFVFQEPDAAPCELDCTLVNATLHQWLGECSSAKDFRTWGGTLTAINDLLADPEPESDAACAARLIRAADSAAAHLGNTRAVCRAHYIHPAIFQAAEKGSLWKEAERLNDERSSSPHLTQDEHRAILLLEQLS